MRLFLAVSAPAVDIPPPAGFRAVPAADRHVTLVFIGEEGDARGVAAAARAVAARHAPFELRFHRQVGLPDPRRARVAAAEAEPSPGFRALVEDLRAALAPFGEVARERREPRPHVTLGRRREPAPMVEGGLPAAIRVAVADFHLFRSDLTPTGPIYTALDGFRLGGGGEASLHRAP